MERNLPAPGGDGKMTQIPLRRAQVDELKLAHLFDDRSGAAGAFTRRGLRTGFRAGQSPRQAAELAPK
jgi:hypothetical protein